MSSRIASFAGLSLIFAVTLTACDTAPAPTQPTAAFSGGSTTGGGGTGGGGTTTAPCTYIQSLNPKPGFYPGSKTMGAIWTDATFVNCTPTIPLYAVLGGHRTGYVEASPWMGGVGYESLSRWNVWSPVIGDTRSYKTPTIDQEPVDVASSYDIWVSVFNALTNTVVETRTVTVVTPATPVATTTVP